MRQSGYAGPRRTTRDDTIVIKSQQTTRDASISLRSRHPSVIVDREQPPVSTVGDTAKPDQTVAVPSIDARPVAILLAAGGGHRFQGNTHKLLTPVAGPGGGRRSVVEHALRAVIASDIGPVVVVSGAVDLADTLATVTADVVERSITAIEHDGWAAGQASSLAVGVRTAIDLGATSVVVGLGDQPGITPAAWRRVASAAQPIAVATYDGRRGNPVRLASDVWPLLPTEGDEGARSLMRLRPDLVGEVACDGSAFDIDTLEDLARWQNS